MTTSTSIVGQPRLARVDARAKATGEAAFTDDITLSRMLVGRILRSPHPHATILGIDTSKARRLRGVKAVVTAAEAPRSKIGLTTRDEEVLAVEKVRFLGDHVAAVAAVDEDTAEEALSLIQVEYAALPAVFDPVEALRPDAPKVHGSNTNVGFRISGDRGDVEAGFGQADLIFEESFSTQRVSNAALEPFSCTVSFDISGRGQVWVGAKDIFGVRKSVSEYLSIPESDIRVFQAHVGGCFGGKAMGTRTSFCCLAALLARSAGLPVRLANTHAEELLAGPQRIPMVVKMRLGLKNDGTVVAKDTTVIANAGAYLGSGVPILNNAARRHDSLYRFQNVRTDAYLVYTNTSPGAPFRGFGSPQGHFAIEAMLDMAAEKLGIDPVEIRKRNAVHAGDVTAHGWEIRSCGLTECIDSATGNAGWGKRGEAKPSGVGIGIGCMIHVSGRRLVPDFCGSRAVVKIEKDGRVTVFSGEGELGQGSHTVFAIIAAEELGVSLQGVQVAQPDTDTCPIAIGLHTDRGTIHGGSAVRLAANDAKRQLLSHAAEMIEAKAEDLTIVNGRIHVKGYPDRSLSFAEAANYALSKRDAESMILGRGSYDPPSSMPDKTHYGNVSTSYTFAAQVAKVQVDKETGKVKVLSVSAAHDLGRAINPMAAEGQVHGAAVQGMGFGLFENSMEEEEGIPNASFLEYHLPTSLDVPEEVHTDFVETNDPFGPFGAKGIGEPGLVPMAPAVANAVYDAIGVRINDLPITPDKIVRVLSKLGGQ